MMIVFEAVRGLKQAVPMAQLLEKGREGYSAHNSTYLAAQKSGQQPDPGSPNIQDGITVDLSRIADVEVLPQDNIVRIGAGARWGKVYEALDPVALSTSGCRSVTGGVGRLALVGSFFFFSSREGFI